MYIISTNLGHCYPQKKKGNTLRLSVILLSLYFVVYSHQQTIELFEYRQQDSDTNCTDGLLSDVDAVVFTLRVEYYQDPSMEHVFLLMKRGIDKIYYIEKEYNIQKDCNDLHNGECKRIDEHKVEMKLHIKASKDISGARLRGKAITSLQRDIFSDDKIIPEVYDSKDHNVSLVINGEQQNIENDDCNCNVSDSHLSISFLLESQLSPFYIDMSSNDRYIDVQGNDHVEYYIKTNFSVRFNITITYYPCGIEGFKNTIRCNINIEKLNLVSPETGNCICTCSIYLMIVLTLVLVIQVIYFICCLKKYSRKICHSAQPPTSSPSPGLLRGQENQAYENETDIDRSSANSQQIYKQESVTFETMLLGQ